MASRPKLVDLGAAATFAQQSAPTQPKATQGGLLVGDLAAQQQTASSGSGFC